jgi:DNA replication protein DnaC
MKSTEEWKKRALPNLISRFSPRIQKDLEKLPFLDLKEVESTYLWGNVGSGKTIRAAQMCLCDQLALYLQGEYQGFLFIPVQELFNLFKMGYSTKTSESELLDKYSDVHLLVLDDLGAEKTSEWSWDLLSLLINRRYEGLKKTIITSNFDLATLAEKLGDDRIPSRIQRMCKVIEFTKSYTNG